METLMERLVSTNTRCYSCGSLVYAMERKKTSNHIYHDRCFRCRICKRNLTESTLNEEGDDIYCTNCYRKKQRGDCNGLDFQRAANERAQYVHNRHHPDQPPPTINLRPPVRHDLSRNPSWTLRQLERQFLSHQEPNTKDSKKLNENYQQITSIPHPLTIKTSFSVPINLTSFRRNSSKTKDESSPPLQFFPVFSSFPTDYTESPVTKAKTFGEFPAEKINENKVKSTNDIRFRLNRSNSDFNKSTKPPIARKYSFGMDMNRSNSDLNKNTKPPIERQYSFGIDMNRKYENKDKNSSKFYFPDTNITPITRRSGSVNYSINPLKIK